MRSLGMRELARVLASYVAAKGRTRGSEDSFEEWVSRRFGRRLYEMFFRPYTEKVWGVPCAEIRADWAAQRIRGLSVGSAARTAIGMGSKDGPRTLASEFLYPRRGPGQLWERMRAQIEGGGGEVATGAGVDALHFADGRLAAVATAGRTHEPAGVISSLALRDVALLAEPAPPPDVIAAARGLRYRDFLTVVLVLDGAEPFPDTWIYVHDPDVAVARIQNYRAWSPALVPHPNRASVGMEYFCFEGDAIWSSSDEELVARASAELAALGLAEPERVVGSYVARVPRAYPIYDADYAARTRRLRSWLDGIRGLQQVGRNGLHRYNNSDHSMLTAMLAVENLVDGARHDLWSVNADSWYLESSASEEQPYRAAPLTPVLAAQPQPDPAGL
jgi:protoporphyrinogen oxidase